MQAAAKWKVRIFRTIRNVPLPTTAVTNEFLTAARGMGFAKEDFAVVFKVLEHMSRAAEPVGT